MSTEVNFARIDPTKCLVCQSPTDHLKQIDGTQCVKLHICSDKCKKQFMEKLVCHGNIDPQRKKDPVIIYKAKRLT